MSCNLTDALTAAITLQSLIAESTSEPEHPTSDEVSRLAYQYYEERGRQNGRDVEDWLRAERELKYHYAYYE